MGTPRRRFVTYDLIEGDSLIVIHTDDDNSGRAQEMINKARGVNTYEEIKEKATKSGLKHSNTLHVSPWQRPLEMPEL